MSDQYGQLRRGDVPFTDCKTVSNSRIERDRHGVTIVVDARKVATAGPQERDRR